MVSRTNVTLRDDLLAIDEPVFASLDGAQFPDLPDALFAVDLRAVALFRERTDPTQRDYNRTAPRLLSLDGQTDWDGSVLAREDTLGRLLELIGDNPAAVFWACPAGPDVLFDHLRRINRVLYPAGDVPPRPSNGGAPSDETASSEPAADAGYEWVTFRHADARAFVQVASNLSDANRSKLLGPASEVLAPMDGSPAGNLERFIAQGVPTSSVGPLRLSPDEVRRIEATRLAEVENVLDAYLERTLPREVRAQISDEDRRDYVRFALEDCQELGVATRAGRARWSYMVAMTNGRISRDRRIRDLVRFGGRDPDDQVAQVLRSSARWLREEARKAR